MGQGSINQFVPNQRSPIEGIANALKAVNEYYGIDTHKAETKLAEAKQRAQELENNSTQSTLDGHPDPVAMLKAGFVQVPTAADGAIPASGSPMPGSRNTPASAGGAKSKPLAANDFSVASDAGSSPLFSATNPNKTTTKSPLLLSISNPDGTQSTYAPGPELQSKMVKLENDKAETVLKGQQIAKGSFEANQAERTKYAPFRKEFNDESKAIREQITDLKDAQEGFLSGNEPQEQISRFKNIMTQLGFKRITSATGEIGTPEGIAAKAMNDLNKSTTGHLSPTALHEMSEGVSFAIKSKYAALNDLANFHASQATGEQGGDAESVAKKYMLSGIKTPEPIETRVVKRGDMTILQRLNSTEGADKKSKKWVDVETGQNTPSITGNGTMGHTERAVLGFIGAGKGAVKSVFSPITKMFGGGAE